MALTLAQDAIALLLEMAERREIDPWDVKVVDVIDRFLSELDPFEGNSEPYEANLSQSGQAFLYASMLVLLKAETLSQGETVAAEEVVEEAELMDAADPNALALPPSLEKHLRRRPVAQPPQRRRVTLKELVDQLQAIATALESKPRRGKLRRRRPQSRKQAIQAIAQLAHQENLSELAAALDEFLQSRWAELVQGHTWLDFELLLEFWAAVQACDAEGQPPARDRVGVFWALLLLTSQSKVELAQNGFYQDLHVRLLTETGSDTLQNLPTSVVLD